VPDQRPLEPLPLSPPGFFAGSKLLQRVMWIALGLTIGLTVLAVSRPRPAAMATDTRSASLQGDPAKLDFLKKYLRLPTEVQATEFHIAYHDNSKGMVPGPSDYDLRVVVKVPPDKVSQWVAEMGQPTAPFDVAWAYELLPKEERWRIASPPTYYQRDRVQVVTFEPEGIVFKRVWSE
jgi:hypothetical protein